VVLTEFNVAIADTVFLAPREADGDKILVEVAPLRALALDCLPAALDCVCRLLTEAPVSLPLLIGAAFLLLADLCVLDAPIALQLCRRFDVCFTLGNARAGWPTSSAQSSAPTANSAGRCVWRPTRCVACCC